MVEHEKSHPLVFMWGNRCAITAQTVMDAPLEFRQWVARNCARVTHSSLDIYLLPEGDEDAPRPTPEP